MAYDLSICIPARNEEWLAQTVEDILRNRRGKTEVIIFLDGQWANPGIGDHPDVRIIYSGVSVGQRAATNYCVRLSRAKYVAKCDAHVAFSEGFDIKLMEALKGHDDWTITPAMKNLWVFDWECVSCGHRVYQNPIPKSCEKCGSEVKRTMVWLPNPNRPTSTAFHFDAEPHFQYHNEQKRKQVGDVVESMSLQGSFFMATREKYWELGLSSEEFGSWGSQGIEVAVKTWLSGGRVVIHRDCWYAHLFRTGDFGFPYPNPQSNVDRAKKHARDLFFGNRWSGQVLPLSWLVEKFWPVPGWTQADLEGIHKYDSRIHIPKGMIFYTDNQLKLSLARSVQQRLRQISNDKNIPIISTSLKPMNNMGTNFHVKGQRGVVTMLKQILTALEKSRADVIFFTEHDVLYHPSHFDFTPPTKDKFYYNTNVWRIRASDGKAVTWKANQVAELCCSRDFAIGWYQKKLEQAEAGKFDRSYEPGGRNTAQYGQWCSEFPNIDVRHDNNLTKSKWSPDDFRDKSTCIDWQETTLDAIPGWDNIASLL